MQGGVKMWRNNKPIVITIASLILVVMSISTACAYTSYNVKKGDSLFKLSTRFNTNISTLSRLNNIQNPNLIYTNQQLKLPEAPQVDSQSTSKYSGNSSASNSTFFGGSSNSQNQVSSNNTTTWQQNNIFTARKKTTADKKKQLHRQNPAVKKIALTFDDGPDDQYTPQILEVLNKYNAPATFFLLGKLTKQHPEVTKRIIKEGHTIGNHSWSHADLTALNETELARELDDTEKILAKITRYRTKLLRPPYGRVSDDLLAKLEETDYEIIHWSIDSLDWKAESKQEILNNVLPHIKQGAIILFHSAGGPTQDLTPTVKALPPIIEAIREQGIQLVTVDELLSLPAYG